MAAPLPVLSTTNINSTTKPSSFSTDPNVFVSTAKERGWLPDAVFGDLIQLIASYFCRRFSTCCVSLPCGCAKDEKDYDTLSAAALTRFDEQTGSGLW